MRDKFHVLIIGGGVAGPALALFLKKAGISSAVYEAYAPGGELGGGLGLAPNGMNVLAVLGLANTLKRRASPARENRIYDERGHRFATYDTGGTEFGEPNISCMRADLHAVVAEECRRQNITIAYRKRLSRLECRDESVVAHFEDGSSAHGDILVGADGIHSRTRREILPGGPEPEFVGIVGIGGAVPCNDVPTLSKADTENFNFVFGPEGFFGYCGGSAGEVMWWSNLPRERPYSSEELRSLSSQALKTQMLARYGTYYEPIPSLIARTEEIIALNVFDVQSLPRWHDGRVMLIGDAAHAVSPNAGQGASQALEDAMMLAKLLRDCACDYRRAFVLFERERKPRVERVVAEGRRRGGDKAIVSPFKSKIRNLMLRFLLPVFGRYSQNWMFRYRIDWESAIETERRAA
jgi:2-polyprenyl-6-methoxyphenol hydroxylase-like FAD-dependent oxidoreductase